MKLQKIASFGKEKIKNNPKRFKNYSTERSKCSSLAPVKSFDFKRNTCFELKLVGEANKRESIGIERGNVCIVGDLVQLSHLVKYFLRKCPVPINIVGKDFDISRHSELFGQDLRLILADTGKNAIKKIDNIIRNCSTAFIFKPFENP